MMKNCKTGVTNDLKQLFERFDNNLKKGTYELNTVFDRALAYSMVENNAVLDDKQNMIDISIKFLQDNKFDEDLVKVLNNERTNNLLKLLPVLDDDMIFNKNLSSDYVLRLIENIFNRSKKFDFFQKFHNFSMASAMNWIIKLKSPKFGLFLIKHFLEKTK